MDKLIIDGREIQNSMEVIFDKDKNAYYVDVDGVLKMIEWIRFSLLQMKQSRLGKK